MSLGGESTRVEVFNGERLAGAQLLCGDVDLPIIRKTNTTTSCHETTHEQMFDHSSRNDPSNPSSTY